MTRRRASPRRQASLLGRARELRYKLDMLPLILIVSLTGLDPGIAAKRLVHPEARTATLRALGALPPMERAAARAAGLGRQVVMLATDSTQAFVDRVLAVRAAALIGGDEVHAPLRILTQAVHSAAATAVAREAARALLQLGAVDSLDSARESLDPEVRALAGRAGGGVALCALLADPWPEVRAAAAIGLGVSPGAPKCLARALGHAHLMVRLNAARAAQSAPDPALRRPLRKLAGDARARLDVRAEAFVALAHLGDYEPARRALSTHLAKGGIIGLAVAAVRAFGVGEGHLEVLRGALGSKADPVRIAAARMLVARGDVESREALAALAGLVEPRRRALIQQLLERLDNEATTGFTIERDAPEDAEP